MHQHHHAFLICIQLALYCVRSCGRRVKTTVGNPIADPMYICYMVFLARRLYTRTEAAASFILFARHLRAKR